MMNGRSMITGKTLGARNYGLLFTALGYCISDRHPSGNVPEQAGWNEVTIGRCFI
jgi:hypothetical protein